jgi:hypothetical protein
MNTRARSSYRLIAVMLLLAALAGCQTPRGPDPTAPPTLGPPAPFVPVHAMAGLNLGEGAYPTLFAPGSYARWLGAESLVMESAPAVSPPPDTGPPLTLVFEDEEAELAAAPPIDMPEPAAPSLGIVPGLLTIECRLVSMFADMSIAYDVVGLRGLHVYLLMPDGRKMTPAQVLTGGELHETQHGALKEFARTNTLVFAVNPTQLAWPVSGGLGPSLRLVLEGYDSLFYFEWQSRPPAEPPRIPIRQREGYKRTQQGYQNTKTRSLEFLHTFD